jgi:AraC-like DNA-binding protein
VTARAKSVADRDTVRWTASIATAAVCMRKVTVAASLLADFLGYLRMQGFDADGVAQRAGLPRQPDPSARVPGEQMYALWTEAIVTTGDHDLGLHSGMSFQPGALDIVGYVMLSAHTASDAVRRGARLLQVLNDGLALDIERRAATTTLRLRMLPVDGGALFSDPRQLVETILAGALYQVRLLTQRSAVPLAVRFRHGRPLTGDREHVRLLGIAPQFAADTDEIVLANHDLDLPLRSANPQLLAAFESHADAALAALHRPDALSDRALHEIVAQLKGEAPTIAQVAKVLAMSPRHLQRGLAHEGTTFQTLLDDARRELSLRHLASPDATVAKVAWLVGFSEPSAFHRAFRRWTGHSPRAGIPSGTSR